MQLKDDLYKRTHDDMREERDELGFLRQPEVRWLSPSLLARSGVEVVVSGTFGKFADKRELQTAEQGPFEYAGDPDVWVDYLSDTGDGWNATYTMAWLLAQEQLTVAGHTMPRGRLLLLGGDQVYPSANPEAYEDRFIGPFASALPRSEPGREPELYALPGNHDWYDGLVSFLRVFCAKHGWIGGWKTRQRRGYFAIRMPGNWWIWAIDIQLDTYIDDVQLDYFRAQPLQPGDNVLLLTAKPAWVKAYEGRVEPASWRYLSFFEDRLIRDRGARLAITLTGDLHHYARYDPEGEGAGDAPSRITAGGGGAYLSATHTLKESLELQSLPRQNADGTQTPRPTVHYSRREIYPRAADSERLAKGVLNLRPLNPEFAALMGGLYALIALAMLAALNGAFGPLEATTASLSSFLATAFGAPTIVLALVLIGGTYGSTDIKPVPPKPTAAERRSTARARAAVGLLHGLLHLLAVTVIVFAGVELLAGVLPGALVWMTWIAVLAVAFIAGDQLGSHLWGQFLYRVHRARGWKAPTAANDVFVAQSIPDYKNFLRMRFDGDGGLTIYAIGVDAACKQWDYQGPEPEGARFEPRGAGPVPTLIDGPLAFDARGNRVAAT